MPPFPLHDVDSAPEGSKPLLENSLASFGMIPGLHAVMAASPEVLEAYQALHALFQKTSLSKEEMTVVWQTINVEHDCRYCVPAHTAIAKRMGVDDAITEALRNGTPLTDPKLEALRVFTLDLVRSRGHVEEAALQTFLEAGFTQQNVLEIVLGLAQKVMSNYTNHLAKTPVDAVFEPFAWSKAS